MLKFVSRGAVLAVALASLALAAPGVRAAPVTYNVTLSGAGNPISGSGSFTIDGSALSGVSNEFFTPSNPAKTLLGISFDIGGRHFDLTDALGGFAQVFFQNGRLAGITFQGLDGGNIQVSLNVGALGYVFSDTTTGHSSTGALALAPTPGPAVVPEPASLVLLGAGLAGLAGLGGLGGALFRRRRAG